MAPFYQPPTEQAMRLLKMMVSVGQLTLVNYGYSLYQDDKRPSMLLNKWKIFTLALLLSVCSLAQAVMVPNMYDATLPSQSSTQVQDAELFAQGLIQVLERISAGKAVENQAVVQIAMKNVMTYVDQYTHEGDQLLVKFNPDLINKLIHEMGQTAWGQSRPSVVLWLAVEEQTQRRLIGSENEPELQIKIQEIAQKQGLPVLLPLMDLQDVSAVTATDIWGQFASVLRDASKRYSAQAILVGRIMHHQDQSGDKTWEGHWQLLTDSETPSWTVHSQTLEDVIAQGLSGTTRLMMGHYGVHNSRETVGNDKPILIGVKDIQTEADFAIVEAYFQSLDQVNQVSINQVGANLAIFEVTPKMNHNKDALAQAISLDHHLVVLNSEQANAETELLYRFVP